MKIDHLLGALMPACADKARRDLCKSVLLDVQNVHEFFRGTHGPAVNWDKIPNPMPPWPAAFLVWRECGEWAAMGKTREDAIGELVGCQIEPALAATLPWCGAFVTSAPSSEPNSILVIIEVYSSHVRSSSIAVIGLVGRLANGEVVIDGAKAKVYIPEHLLRSSIDNFSAFLASRGRPPYGEDHIAQIIAEGRLTIAKEVLLAFSFANCRNVRRVCEEVPAKLRKARERGFKRAVLAMLDERIREHEGT